MAQIEINPSEIYSWWGTLQLFNNRWGCELAKDKFDPGVIQITHGVARLVESNGLLKSRHVDVAALLKRHLAGDWGEFPSLGGDDEGRAECRASNDRGTWEFEGSIYSEYAVPGDERVFIISYVDKETTLLLPEEY